MSALLIAGSPSERSRSAALLDAVAQRLSVRGALVDRVHIRDLSPQALLLVDFGHPTVVKAIDQVADASVLVVATPVYNAAYRVVRKVVLFMSGDAIPLSAQPQAPSVLEDRPLGLRDALRWLGVALLVVASLVVIGAFLLMPVVPVAG